MSPRVILGLWPPESCRVCVCARVHVHTLAAGARANLGVFLPSETGKCLLSSKCLESEGEGSREGERKG